MLGRIDSWLLENVYEPMVWRLLYNSGYGLSQFILARFFILVAVSGLGVLTMIKWQESSLAFIGYMFLFVALLICVVLRFYHLGLVEKELRKGFLNRLKICHIERFWRIMQTVLLPFVIGGHIFSPEQMSLPTTIGHIGYILHAYFAACDNPSPRWLQEQEDKEFGVYEGAT